MCEAVRDGEVLREEISVKADALSISREVIYCFGLRPTLQDCTLPIYWAWIGNCTLQVVGSGTFTSGPLAERPDSGSEISIVSFEHLVGTIAADGLGGTLQQECGWSVQRTSN